VMGSRPRQQGVATWVCGLHTRWYIIIGDSVLDKYPLAGEQGVCCLLLLVFTSVQTSLQVGRADKAQPALTRKWIITKRLGGGTLGAALQVGSGR
jgi:hypothetical protein